MRRSHASRPILHRRRTRPRRRIVAAAAAAASRRRASRPLITLALRRAIASADWLRGWGRLALDRLRSIPVHFVIRRIEAQAAVVATAFGNARHATWQRARSVVAGLRRTGAGLGRRIAALRLPEIPGGDPLRFGAAVGLWLIVGAALAGLVITVLREDGTAPQTVAELPDIAPGGTLREPSAEGPAALSAHRSDVEAELPQAHRGLDHGIAEPAPAVAAAPDGVDATVTAATADDDENLAAALPLLGMTEELPQRPDLRGPKRPPVPPYYRDLAPPARPQWLANAVPVERRSGKSPMIAIVIDDAGVAQARTARAIGLPAPLTIAFIPYSHNLKQQTRQARENGHELLLHIPMEPGSSVIDPGPNALLTSLESDEIMRRFRWALSRFDGYVGVNNHMGSKFMARADLVAPLLAEMNARGLMFLDSRTDSRTVGAELAREIALPHASRHVFLDNDLDADKIAAQLAELERLARRRGHAIAIGHPHDVTVDVLANWIPDARARGFDLVPVSAIVKLEYGGADGLLAAATGRGEPDGLLGSPQ